MSNEELAHRAVVIGNRNHSLMKKSYPIFYGSVALSLFAVAAGCGGRAAFDGKANGGSAGLNLAGTTGEAGSGGANPDTGGSHATGGAGAANAGVGGFGTGNTGNDTGTGGIAGAGGTPQALPPSCDALAPTCGHDGNEDCCSASTLPAGGFSYQVNDGVTRTITNSVSAFVLDKYEITVGRFRNFVSVYRPDLIPAGAGKNPHNASDPGWDPTWNAMLPQTVEKLVTTLKCDPEDQSWTDAPEGAASENRPIQCLSWFEAEAFCIWDGGRLPTSAEWTYAAGGGDEQRPYPWGTTEPDCSYANFLNGPGAEDYCFMPGIGGVNPVGSESPKGDGRWGQADLAGNSWEWVQDYSRIPTSPCVDCAVLTMPSPNGFRRARGGSYTDNASAIHVNVYSGGPSETPLFGARCARPVSTNAEAPAH